MRVSQPDVRRALAVGLCIFLLLLIVQIVIERLMGRIWTCSCGEIKLFERQVHSPGNSQHLSDWYTPSHVIHGFLFYGLGWLLFRKRSISFRIGFATLIEAVWEILENSPIIINRYRAATIAFDYYGDSILNSAMDTTFMLLGFLLAWRLPIRATIVVAVVAELTTGMLIRDNLTLNVLMLIHPLDAIKVWQAGV